MATVTRIPEVLTKLVTVSQEAAPTLQVVDGPYIGELDAEVLLIGLPDGSQPGYRATISRQQGMGRPRLTEAWDVRALLSLSTAENDLGALRSRAGDVLAALDAKLRDEHTSAGVWDRAALAGQMDWIPLQGPTGATVAVLFTVEGVSLL